MKDKELELINQLVEVMDNPLDVDYREEEAIKVFEEIGKIEGAMELFRAMMGRDIKLYFQAQSDIDRAGIKGAYARMAWMRGIIKKINEKKELDIIKAKRTV